MEQIETKRQASLSSNGKELPGADVANLFNSHFAAVGCPQHNVVQIPCENFITSNCLNTICLYPTDEYEIISEILSLKDGCSSGADEIKPRPLKAVSSIIAVSTNLILSTANFPDKMKLARVVAIHKGGPPDDLNNYRPISVLSIFAKIVEQIINERTSGY